MSNAKVKINVQSGELEFEGTDEFVKEQMNKLEDIVDIIAQLYNNDEEYEVTEILEDEQQEEQKLKDVEVEKNSLEATASFGEWHHKFNEELTDADNALITAYFIQLNSENNEFKTKEVNDTLKEHGIKLTNTSRTLNWLADKKLTFQIGKDGQIKYFRVSADGIKHLKSLLR